MSASARPQGNLRRFLPYYRKYLPILALDLFCALLTTMAEVVFPLIVQRITDQAVADIAGITAGFLLRLGAFYIGLRILDAIAYYYMQSVGHVMGAKIETDMRTDLFAHLQQLSFSYYNNTKVGQLMSRMTSDLFDVTEFAHHCPEEFLIAAVKITAAFVILLGVNVPLTLIVFAMLPVMMLSTYFFSGHLKRTFAASRHQLGEINAQTEDSLLGMRVVQSFANEEMEAEKFGRGNREFLRLKKKQYKVMAGFHISTRLLRSIMEFAVVILGAIFLARGQITAGQYVSYLLYITMLLNAVARLVEFTEQFQRGMTGIARFGEVMDAPLEIKDLPGAKPIQDVKGEIRFDHVSFHYQDDASKMVLEDVDLTVQAGQSVALVGPSGSGKTTLCNLIPRFYDVTGGRILIDGQDIKGIE